MRESWNRDAQGMPLRLNPYSNGIYSMRSGLERALDEFFKVLILILMEYTL